MNKRRIILLGLYCISIVGFALFFVVIKRFFSVSRFCCFFSSESTVEARFRDAQSRGTNVIGPTLRRVKKCLQLLVFF
jgi:hypothetical protein